MLANKKIAYVCPSNYLNNKKIGKLIDSYDIICRIGEAGPLDSALHASYGSRTDIIITAGSSIWFSFFEKHIDYFKHNIKYVINSRADNE
jgi:hypothetical protein